MDAAFIVLSLPMPNDAGKIDLPGYSLGPVSSDGVQELVLNAIPASDGNVYFTGRGQWTGLENVNQPSSRMIQSIVGISDSQILFLWWREPDGPYETLIRLPYSEIYSVDLSTFGLGAVIKFCHEDNEILIGDQIISIDHETRFNFLKSGFFGDAEKTKEAFVFLENKIILKEGLEHLPSPCEDVVESDAEDQGFGEDDFTERP